MGRWLGALPPSFRPHRFHPFSFQFTHPAALSSSLGKSGSRSCLTLNISDAFPPLLHFQGTITGISSLLNVSYLELWLACKGLCGCSHAIAFGCMWFEVWKYLQWTTEILLQGWWELPSTGGMEMSRALQSLHYLSQGVAQPTPAVRLRWCLCAVFCHCKWIAGVLPLTQGFMWMKNIKECHSFTFAFAHSYIGIQKYPST